MMSSTTQTINDAYQLGDVLGQGGMAIVYKAEHLELHKTVAVKVIKAIPDEQSRMRFLQELIAITAIEHPNILRVQDFGITVGSNELFLVMDYIEGRTLDDELKALGIIPVQSALSMFVQVLRAIELCHQQGIIHKDIKPSNFMIDQNDQMILMDFGIAHQMGTVRLTEQTHIATTIQYSAPEYLRNQSVSPQLDIYQMGLVLIEMLSGQRAVDSTDPIECLKRHCLGALNIPRAIKSSHLWLVLSQAIAVEPHERFESAKHFADALEMLNWHVIEQQLHHMQPIHESAALILKEFTTQERKPPSIQDESTQTVEPPTLQLTLPMGTEEVIEQTPSPPPQTTPPQPTPHVTAYLMVGLVIGLTICFGLYLLLGQN